MVIVPRAAERLHDAVDEGQHGRPACAASFPCDPMQQVYEQGRENAVPRFAVHNRRGRPHKYTESSRMLHGGVLGRPG